MAINKFSKFVIVITAIGIAYAVFLIIKNPQPFGKIALLAFTVLGLATFIKHKIVKGTFQVIALISGLLFSALGTRSLLFNHTNEKLLDSKTEVVFSELSFSESLKKAKAENKLVFVDFYTVWCAPCITFHKDVLNDKAVAEIMNQTFVNKKFDLYRGEGISLKERYNVYYVPRFLILDGEGNIVEDISTDTALTKERMIYISKKHNNIKHKSKNTKL
ncbi:putative disulphide-isomerase [Flavobacteriales bacterium ALC-1]|nr:putative disulphide-isomerase [Flavobacteriales bacterium ALC-1]